MDVCACVYSVCVVLCIGSGLPTGLSLVQGVLPSVKNDYGTEEEARGPVRAVRAFGKKNIYGCTALCWTLAAFSFLDL
jgi:hypothetical protein